MTEDKVKDSEVTAQGLPIGNPTDLPLDNVIPTDLPMITANYRVIHFDEEPILFTGTNKYGNRILASLADVSDEAMVSWYFHIIVDPRTYADFRKQKLSYLDVMRGSSVIYILERRFDGTTPKVCFTSFDAIPENHRPLEDSFCPEQPGVPTLSYSIRLCGLTADENSAFPKDIAAMQTAFAEQLESNIFMLKDIVHGPPTVTQRAYSPGSFQLNFDIEVRLADALFMKTGPIAEYVNEFIAYCADHLPAEAEKIYEPEPEKLPFFSHLLREYEQLYDKSCVKLPDKYVEKVKDEVRKASESIAEMTEMLGEHFTGIEIVNEGDTSRPIAFMDADFKTTIESVVTTIQGKTQHVEEDTAPKEYEIWVYHLNRESRTGNAIVISDDQERKMSKPKIRISGEEPLESTKYTESLYRDKPIKVKAKAKKVDGKVRSLAIEFEEK